MASPSSRPSRLARMKAMLLTRILPCCGERKKPVRPLQIHPPKDFRRIEIKFEGLTPEQEAFLREKAFLEAHPPTPPLPLLSPTGTTTTTTPTTSFPSTTSADPLLLHNTSTSNTLCSSYSPPTHHHTHTYTSASAPHLSTTLTSVPSSGRTNATTAHHQHSYPYLRTPPFDNGMYDEEGRVKRPRPRSRRFSAITINLLRGSWNSSHPVSAADTEVVAVGRTPQRARVRLRRGAFVDGYGDGRRGGGRWEFFGVSGGGEGGMEGREAGEQDCGGKRGGLEMGRVEVGRLAGGSDTTLGSGGDVEDGEGKG
ncbi:hypothetical protein B0J12DRAFT_760891 [Macrophomina phaseolina]|uniref:Uncharacterized protein n=1 Tax=Macrophomina phaseolina TaxID=35725 RepID=A0ABQ8G2V0_9PEZI|nr:hypothetical protein B0J12DRAFT_760891 [Macrophomina phaseolina]